MRFKQRSIWFLVMPALLLSCASAWAAFGEDIEKPKPEFAQKDGDWIVRLIPRGKSTSVQIEFHVDGGTLTAVSGKEYPAENHPKVDPKNFRSDFFSIQASTPLGGEVTVSCSSNYFTSATDLWGPVSPNSITWGPTGAVNTALADRVNLLSVKVRDGGPLDADGTANGRIEIIVGSRDSFWGYALGTLFIRFFGIFIVLSVLMAGMMFSGSIFQWIEKRREPPLPAPSSKVREPAIPAGSTDSQSELSAGAADGQPELSAEAAAAVAMALHLHQNKDRPQPARDVQPAGVSAWTVFGRGQIMSDRLPVFERVKRK
jgi:hypothetical protein